jgi:hypothetical protein
MRCLQNPKPQNDHEIPIRKYRAGANVKDPIMAV